MTNPINEYVSNETAAQTKRKAHEIELWARWKNEGQQREHLQPLLKLYDGVFGQKMRAWKPPMVPDSVFHAELQKQFINALDAYDPSRGAALNTHVENRLKKAMRLGNRYANLSYIPEAQAGKIGKLLRAQTELTEEYGRPPTHAEIANHLGMHEKQVTTVLKAVKRDVPMSITGGPEGTGMDYAAGAERTGRGFEDQQIAVASTILPTLFPNKPEMAQLFHYTFGTGGHPQIQSTSTLAKKMGKSEPQISRMKTQMGGILRKHMFGEDEK